MKYLLIDTSYLIFYRYYALVQWWKLARPGIEIGIHNENEEFVEKFKKTMIEIVGKIKKDLKITKEKVCVIGAKDCSRVDIWRNKLYKEYKEQRTYDDDFMGGPFFAMTFNDNLLEQAGCEKILYCDSCEADDIIAITKMWIRKKDTESEIIIIANDMDYLQLCDDKCKIVNLKKKNLIEGKNAYSDPAKNLFVKIITGDKSDNIKPIFKKCGVKEAERLYDDNDAFIKRLENEDGAKEKYELNRNIIDFNMIPQEYVQKVESLLV